MDRDLGEMGGFKGFIMGDDLVYREPLPSKPFTLEDLEELLRRVWSMGGRGDTHISCHCPGCRPDLWKEVTGRDGREDSKEG